MLNIENKEKFNEIVTEALAKSKNFPRWQNAINKAVVQIELHGEFITYLPETKSIVIWSQESNAVHSANGVCDCIAFEKGFPCYHRAMARLIRLYMESETAQAVDMDKAPYLKPSSTKTPERIGRIRI
jgi:hypothetical protein